MFSSFIEVAKNSPFKSPFSRAQCEPSLGPWGPSFKNLKHDHDDQDDEEETLVEVASNSGDSCEFGSNKFLMLCGIGGILSCGTTHTLVTPLDLVKCRLQIDKAKYKNLIHGLKVTTAEEGILGLTTGWFPTLVGYSCQGLFKFGLYEFFKIKYAQIFGDEFAYKYRTYLYLMASASAEVFADVALCPLEAVKVKMQTIPGYAKSFRQAVPKMLKEGGVGGFYSGLVPLWCRQIPYTMMKFACFERTVELLYKYVVPRPREECSKAEQLIVTFAAGYIAGVFCAVVSHPADVLVSKMNQAKGASAGDIIKSLGFMGMWGGLTTRIIMIGTLTALQWFIYDGVKVALGIPRPPPPEMPASMRK